MVFIARLNPYCVRSTTTERLSQSRRPFSSTSCRCGHYQTLEIPQNATKNQIKASYYKLSKKYHPDITKESGTKEKFQAVSDAYAVLGDDRKRRAYDRSLTEGNDTRHHSSFHAHASPYSSHWSYETRRRGATYAWDPPRRPGHTSHRPPPGAGPSAYRRPNEAEPNLHYDPWKSPNVQRATGRKTNELTEEERVAHVSSFWRAVQVIGIVMIVATVGGGLSASAA